MGRVEWRRPPSEEPLRLPTVLRIFAFLRCQRKKTLRCGRQRRLRGIAGVASSHAYLA